MGFNWTCPYCGTKTTVNTDKHKKVEDLFTINNAEGNRKFYHEWIVCPNDECGRINLRAELFDTSLNINTGRWVLGEKLKEWNLLPNSFAKSFPDYIPKPLIDDYEEACAILELSPKASATLSRRCLQGIIRDFWKIKKGRLVDEINALEDKIDPITWKSIDAVRKVGNIGAHMEKDINLIIEVDPKEAKLLIELIEMLFEEWYIHRHERELKLKAISAIAEDKDNQKKGDNTDQAT
ncbi:DUF4145 domain-containing protein [Flagellimonas aequoris]|uniref:DUF4145 domain-containing protein n=1 Tax=Flagellimonas aequoris TaxID=2306997 RepID=A0A418N4R6_9FLAO|nr:DUF4145 domain-containing protein [Allomuricauda aequoris]RIV68773.1 DUF4145 domain-containing protein [Allomuricauda aequoris]TXK00473.1 DUF4145 domain-containing protein [Allomuricauda aequoris]